MGEDAEQAWFPAWLDGVSSQDFRIAAVAGQIALGHDFTSGTIHHRRIPLMSSWRESGRAPGWRVAQMPEPELTKFPPFDLTADELDRAYEMAETIGPEDPDPGDVVFSAAWRAMHETPKEVGEGVKTQRLLADAADDLCDVLGEDHWICEIACRLADGDPYSDPEGENLIHPRLVWWMATIAIPELD